MKPIDHLHMAPGYRNSFVSFTPDGPAYQERCFPPTPLRPALSQAEGGPHGRLALPLGGRQTSSSEKALTEDQMVATVLDILITQKVDYGDFRLGREVGRSVSILDTNLSSHQLRESEGIGIRVYHGGAWGFASTMDLSYESLERCAKRAIEKARISARSHDFSQLHTATANFRDRPKTHTGSQKLWERKQKIIAEFHTPVLICPLSAPTESLTHPLIEAAAIGQTIPGIKRVQSHLECYGRRRIFADTLGSHILSTHMIVDASQRFVAVDKGTSAYRTVNGSALAGGLEHFYSAAFPKQAAMAALEARLKCAASKPVPGYYDLILDPHNLALTMHESVGHPTELDRVLGYELGFAGGSFAQVKDLGKLVYGSELVNFTANNQLLFGGSSTGFDDEGTPCQKFPIIQNGLLVGFGNSLETSCHMGEAISNGNARSTSWCDVPIVRIPNLFLEPGTSSLSLNNLIGHTDRGILMLGHDSFSIDQMRANFQFGADMSYLIEKGKVVGPLRDVIYQSLTPDFWGACDAICDASEWQMHGVYNCGKGQPMQLGKMMHGASPARFRQIKVGF